MRGRVLNHEGHEGRTKGTETSKGLGLGAGDGSGAGVRDHRLSDPDPSGLSRRQRLRSMDASRRSQGEKDD
jgi:hypothetical protein